MWNVFRITEKQYNEAKMFIKQYKSEQLDLLRVMLSKSATTSIPLLGICCYSQCFFQPIKL